MKREGEEQCCLGHYVVGEWPYWALRTQSAGRERSASHTVQAHRPLQRLTVTGSPPSGWSSTRGSWQRRVERAGEEEKGEWGRG